jgi:hypothetical protein
MEYRGGSESAYTITITAEVVLSELIEDGPEAFAKRVRESLEAELEPLARLDWKKLRRPAQPTRPQEVVGDSPPFVDRNLVRDVKTVLDSRNRTKT